MNLPSYEDCQQICKTNPNYSQKTVEIDGVPVHIFSSLLPDYGDVDESLNRLELRGLTFVEEPSGMKRYLHLHKFFNVNEVESTKESNFVGKEIVRISKKEDGSLLTFIPINNKLYAKTKKTFESHQAIDAQKLLDKNLESFIKACYESNITPIFEFVSPTNTIVVISKKPALILLQMRDNDSGEYIINLLNHPLVKKYGITPVKDYKDMTLNDLLKIRVDLEGEEGWVIQYKTGEFIKVKTEWYVKLHSAVFRNDQENNIIASYLNNTIDDSISLVSSINPVIAKKMRSIVTFLNKYINETSEVIYNHLRDNKDLTRKEYALKYRENFHFSFISMGLKTEGEGVYNLESIKERVLKFVEKKCYRLFEARAFLSTNGYIEEEGFFE